MGTFKPKIKIENIASLKDAKKKLKDETLGLELVDGGVEVGFSHRTKKQPKVSVGITAGAGATVSVFNNEDDKDEDGLLGKKPNKKTSFKLAPQVELTDKDAWLKYRFNADVKGSVGTSVSNVGLSFSAEKHLVVSDYRKHDRDDIVLDAILADLEDPRFVFDRDHVAKLQQGDCLAARWSGKISAKVTVTWGDIFSTQFGNLGTVLNTGKVIPLKFESGAAASFKVSVEDDFIVALSLANSTSYRVAVRKAKSTNLNFSASASVEVGFANPKDLQDAVSGVLDGLLGQPVAALEKLDAKMPFNKLSAKQQGLVLKALDKLGVDAELAAVATNPVGVLLERIAEARGMVEGKVREIATSKVKLAFKYEYSRISTSTSLLQATFAKNLLAKHHKGLVTGNIEGFLDAIRKDDPGIELEGYLNRKEIVTTRSYGFTLGIGSWSAYGKDKKQITRVIDENILGARRFSYNGLRTYDAKWIGEKFTWTFDFKAEMDEFVEVPGNDVDVNRQILPRVTDYQYGVSLIWERSEKLSGKVLERVLDSSTLWGVFEPESYETVRGAVADIVGKTCDITIQMNIGHDMLADIHTELASATVNDFAGPLGAAMPQRDGYPARTSAAVRRELYGPLWEYYFEHPDARPDALARKAERYFLDFSNPDFRELRQLELQYDMIAPWTFAGLARLNGNTIEDLESFLRGLQNLSAAITAKAKDKNVVADAFDKMQRFAKQSHHIRAAGVFLNDAIARSGKRTDVVRTLKIEQGSGKDKVEHVFGQ